MAEGVFQVHHRHVVFTIDQDLWMIFLKHGHLLKECMNVAFDIVQD